jgi:DNA-binding beta-propeller fold protein YncE
VLRVDPKTPRQVDRVPLPGADAIAVGLGSVFVSNTSEDKVVQIDLTDSAFATIGVGGGPLRIAAGEGAVWVLNSVAGTVSRIDPRLQQVTLTIEVRGAVSLAAGEGGPVGGELRPASCRHRVRLRALTGWLAGGGTGI